MIVELDVNDVKGQKGQDKINQLSNRTALAERAKNGKGQDSNWIQEVTKGKDRLMNQSKEVLAKTPSLLCT